MQLQQSFFKLDKLHLSKTRILIVLFSFLYSVYNRGVTTRLAGRMHRAQFASKKNIQLVYIRTRLIVNGVM
jgi:hypothetical protein